MKKMSKKSIMVITFILLLSFSGVAFAALPTVSFLTPSSNAYLLQGNTTKVSGTVLNVNTFPAFYYGGNFIDIMLPVSGTNTYQKWWYHNAWYTPANSGGTWYFPNGSIKATNNEGTQYAYRPMYVATSSKSFYTGLDTTFYYNGDILHPFKGVGTGLYPVPDGTLNTYNCLAYSVGVTYKWMWPWSGSPTLTDLQNYFKNYGYTTVSTTKTGAKIIYYSGNHFSKVVAWDTSGNPTRIISKWGAAELIQSASYSPFTSGYGTAKYFIK